MVEFIASFILLYNIFATEVKMCLYRNLIWVMLLMGQLHGYESCIEKERNALLELKKYLISQSIEGGANSVLPTWSNDTKSECCLWEGLKCSGTSGLVTEIAFGGLHLKKNTILNLSLLHPFKDVRSLNLSGEAFSGLSDDVEGTPCVPLWLSLNNLCFIGALIFAKPTALKKNPDILDNKILSLHAKLLIYFVSIDFVLIL